MGAVAALALIGFAILVLSVIWDYEMVPNGDTGWRDLLFRVSFVIGAVMLVFGCLMGLGILVGTGTQP